MKKLFSFLCLLLVLAIGVNVSFANTLEKQKFKHEKTFIKKADINKSETMITDLSVIHLFSGHIVFKTENQAIEAGSLKIAHEVTVSWHKLDSALIISTYCLKNDYYKGYVYDVRYLHCGLQKQNSINLQPSFYRQVKV